MARSRWRSRVTLLSIAMLLIGALSASLLAPQPAKAADDALIFSLLHRSIEEDAPDLGPQSGALTAPGDEPALSVVGIGSRDFAVRVTCLLPAVPNENPADCGIAFRRNADGQSLLITITANGNWDYGRTGEDPVQSGETSPLVDGSAVVELFAIGLTGYAGLNGRYLATLDLSLIPSGGALAIGAGFASAGSRPGFQLEFQDLSIWSFDDVVESVDPLEDASFDPASQFETAVGTLTETEPLAGPLEGLLIHTEGRATFSRTGVQAADIVVHLECGPPSAADIEMWDCGIVFRLGEAVDDQFRLIFLSTGRWILARGASITIQDGFFESPSDESGPPITVDLVAAGETGWLDVNGTIAGPLDLSLLGAPGDVAAASAFFASTNVPGGSTSFQQFSVWEAGPAIIESLLGPQPSGTPSPRDPANESDARLFALLMDSITTGTPAFGPESGIMNHDPSTVTLISSALDLENLAARLQCAAPQDADARLWDCGIVWRSNGLDAQLRLAVVSDGFWSLRTGAAQVIAEGSGLRIDSTPGSVMTIEVVALGDEGLFAVNGTFVARLDLSSTAGAGDILAGTAFFNESYADGGSTAYEQFAVWSIAPQPAIPVAAATPIPAAASPTTIPSTPGALEATPDTTGDIDAPSPVSESSPATLDDIQALEPSNQARALIEPVEGQEIHGYGVATRVARSIDVSILIANARPGDIVTIQPGVCGALSPDLPAMETVGALNAQGIIVTTLPLRLTEILSQGTYSMVVYTAADSGFANPLACGELVAE